MFTVKKTLWELVALMALIGCAIIRLVAVILGAIGVLFKKAGEGLDKLTDVIFRKLQLPEGKYEAKMKKIAE